MDHVSNCRRKVHEFVLYFSNMSLQLCHHKLETRNDKTHIFRPNFGDLFQLFLGDEVDNIRQALFKISLVI